jgi:acetylornithine deacetylase/succinyl-diaminopimelate desuccinylase-like protein
MTTTSASRDAALTWAASHSHEAERWLEELLAIPSVSTQPEHAGDCRAAATWLVRVLERIGMTDARLLETGGHPCVYASWSGAPAGAPTVLVYGHYDVQPPDPIAEWNSPPFSPTRPGDGNIYARGAADDKGQLLVHIASVAACIAEGGLPVNVKFLLEGEEESGSEHLEACVRDHAELLAADVCVISDSHMLSPEQPSIVSSLRGMTYCEVEVQGPAVDLHSGTFGGAVRNPAEALVHILAQLKDESGRILIPGFYDDVVELDAEARAELARVPFSDEEFKRDAGISTTWGEHGYSVYEQTGARPTLEINGLVSGYTGEGAKTVLPARAVAKVSMRLVAHQDWEKIGATFRSHVESLAPSGTTVSVRVLHGGAPSLVDTSDPAMGAAARAMEETWGITPVFTREGGSIPVVSVFEAILGINTVLMGFGLPDDRLHSPNEKFSLRQYHLGIETSTRFWFAYADAMAR